MLAPSERQSPSRNGRGGHLYALNVERSTLRAEVLCSHRRESSMLIRFIRHRSLAHSKMAHSLAGKGPVVGFRPPLGPVVIREQLHADLIVSHLSQRAERGSRRVHFVFPRKHSLHCHANHWLLSRRIAVSQMPVAASLW